MTDKLSAACARIIAEHTGYSNDEDDIRFVAQVAPQMANILYKWDQFMRANYGPNGISWWHEARAILTKLETTKQREDR